MNKIYTAFRNFFEAFATTTKRERNKHLVGLTISVLGASFLIANLMFKISDNYGFYLSLLLIVACFFVIALFTLADYLKRTRIKKSIQSIPTIMQFANRIDTITVIDKNRIEFCWAIDVVADKDEHVTEMLFPVSCACYVLDTKDEVMRDLIKIKELNINGEEKIDQLRIKFKQIRRTMKMHDDDKEMLLISGILQFPVVLHQGKTDCRVEIKAEFNCSSWPLDEGRAIYSDIGFLTEQLEVVIKSSSEMTIQSSPNHRHHFPVEAVSYFTEQQDLLETARAMRHTINSGKYISFKLPYPRLGYRYQLFFSAKERK